jgi:hypothetical protein
VCAVDVVLFGLNIVVPIMTEELLKVCTHYFSSCLFYFFASPVSCPVHFLFAVDSLLSRDLPAQDLRPPGRSSSHSVQLGGFWFKEVRNAAAIFHFYVTYRCSISTDIVKMCMEFLTSIATHVFHNKMVGSNSHQALSHFLKVGNASHLHFVC